MDPPPNQNPLLGPRLRTSNQGFMAIPNPSKDQSSHFKVTYHLIFIVCKISSYFDKIIICLYIKRIESLTQITNLQGYQDRFLRNLSLILFRK